MSVSQPFRAILWPFFYGGTVILLMLTVPPDSFSLQSNCQQRGNCMAFVLEILKALAVQLLVIIVDIWRKRHEKPKKTEPKEK